MLRQDLIVGDGESLYLRNLQISPGTLPSLNLAKGEARTGRRRHECFPRKAGRRVPRVESSQPYLRTTSSSGLLSGAMSNRTGWHLDGNEWCHLLVFNDKVAYGTQSGEGQYSYHDVIFEIGRSAYRLIAFDRSKPGQEHVAYRRSIYDRSKTLYVKPIEVRTYAMALAR